MDEIDSVLNQLSSLLQEIRFKLSRLNGLSTPIGGISWDRVPADLDILGRLIRYLENRQSLYVEYNREVPRYVDLSIIGIRSELNDLLHLHPSPKLAEHLKALRDICLKFSVPHSPHYDSEHGRFREMFGHRLVQMAKEYGITLNKNLSRLVQDQENHQR